MIGIYLVGAMISLIFGLVGIVAWTFLFLVILAMLSPFIELAKKIEDQNNHPE